ncbi:MAG: hypothetical protein JNJ88_00565 [Planctomycetes bacterium]|nr:hypothetical protein [Planctomycetota bacterium]
MTIQNSKLISIGLRVLLTEVLVFAAITKFWAGHHKDFVLPPSLFYGNIVAELLLAISPLEQV